MAIQTTTFKGARYLVKFHDPIEWADTESYEAIEAVQYNAYTYISKQPVPVGVQIDNTDFWLLWADPNAQMEELRQLVANYVEDVQAIDALVDAINDALPISDFDSVNTVKAAIQSINGEIDIINDKLECVTVGHRGYPSAPNIYARDNSQVSFIEAGIYGFDAIECDPRKDKDGHIVMLHDATVNSVAWQTGDLTDYSYDEVNYKTKAGNKTDFTLCTIEDVIKIAKMFNMAVFFDMGKNICTVAEIVEICEAEDFKNIAFFGLADDSEFLTAPDYVVKVLNGYTFPTTTAEIQKLYDTYGSDNYCIRAINTTPATVITYAKNLGFKIFYTVAQTIEELSKDILATVDYIFTDYIPYNQPNGTSYASGSALRDSAGINFVQLTFDDNETTLNQGLSIKKNSNGSITLNGKYTGSGNSVTTIGFCFLQAGNYIFSGNESIENANGYYLQLIDINNDAGTIVYLKNKPISFTVASDMFYMVRIYILASEAAEVTNVNYHPMVRKASIVSDGFIEYRPNIADLKSLLVNMLKANQMYNLVSLTVDSTTFNGVTITNNDDGTITLDGTATSSSGTTVGTVQIVKGVDYIGKGSIYKNGATNSTPKCRMQVIYDTTYTDNRNGFVVNGISNASANVNLYFNNGETFDNEIIEPLFTVFGLI